MRSLYIGAALFFFLVPLVAWADFDVRLNVNVPVAITDTSVSGKIGAWHIDRISGTAEEEESLVGLGGTAAFGYRWAHLGVYFEQSFRGVWWVRNAGQDYDDEAFLGGTFVVGRFFYSFNPDFDMDLGIGFGVMYGDGSGPGDGDGPFRERPLFFDENDNPRACPAIRFAIGGSYYITGNLAVGLHLAYSLAFNYYKLVMYAGRFKSNVKTHRRIHIMDPGIHAIYRF